MFPLTNLWPTFFFWVKLWLFFLQKNYNWALTAWTSHTKTVSAELSEKRRRKKVVPTKISISFHKKLIFTIETHNNSNSSCNAILCEKKSDFLNTKRLSSYTWNCMKKISFFCKVLLFWKLLKDVPQILKRQFLSCILFLLRFQGRLSSFVWKMSRQIASWPGRTRTGRLIMDTD